MTSDATALCGQDGELLGKGWGRIEDKQTNLACRLRIVATISMPERMMLAVTVDLKPSIGLTRRLIRR